MAIIYGVRCYGRVLEYGGEFVASRFFHLCYLPLIPLSSFWVMRPEGTFAASGHSPPPRGLALSFHWLSILCAYLRTWALLVGLILLFASGNPLLGSALIGAFLCSWIWLVAPPSHRARQQFIAAATGLKCNPDLLPKERAESLMRRFLGTWRESFGDSPVEHTPATPAALELRREALRYAVLRLRSRAQSAHEDRARAEALFQRLQARWRPGRAENTRRRPRVVIPGR